MSTKKPYTSIKYNYVSIKNAIKNVNKSKKESPRGDDTTDPRRGSKEIAEAAAGDHKPKNAEHPRDGRNQPDHDEGRKRTTINNKKRGVCICSYHEKHHPL